MTEKRFVCGSGGFYDRFTGQRWLWSEWDEVCKIMNNLDLKARERSKALSKLQKENTNLHKENSRFKESLVAAINHERTDMGKSVLMQLADNLGVDY